MKNHSLIVASILALSAGGYAMAQDQTAPQPTIEQPAKTQPATPETPETTVPDTSAQQPMPSDSNTAQQPAPTENNTVETPAPTDNTNSSAEAPATTADSSVIVSEADLNAIQPWTANEFIGKTVYTTANENVGEINDLVFGNDGKIVGVVIGVGGFLGLGQKEVLVSLESIRMSTPDGAGAVQLVVDASKDTLENARGFDRVAKRYMAIEATPQPEAPAVQPEPETPSPTPTEPQTQTQ